MKLMFMLFGALGLSKMTFCFLASTDCLVACLQVQEEDELGLSLIKQG